MLATIADLARILWDCDGAVIFLDPVPPGWEAALQIDRSGVVVSFADEGYEAPPEGFAALTRPLVAERYGFTSSASMPLKAKDGVPGGVLTVLSRSSRNFAERDLEILRHLVALVQAALLMAKNGGVSVPQLPVREP